MWQKNYVFKALYVFCSHKSRLKQVHTPTQDTETQDIKRSRSHSHKGRTSKKFIKFLHGLNISFAVYMLYLLYFIIRYAMCYGKGAKCLPKIMEESILFFYVALGAYILHAILIFTSYYSKFGKSRRLQFHRRVGTACLVVVLMFIMVFLADSGMFDPSDE